jgi:hypothetical protein
MDKRVMMGKSACDDAVKGIEKDLKNVKRDTECHTKVREQFQNIYQTSHFSIMLRIE